MVRKFGEGVTDRQLALARRFQHACITTYTQAVKAFQRHDNAQIEAWKQELARITLEAEKQIIDEWKAEPVDFRDENGRFVDITPDPVGELEVVDTRDIRTVHVPSHREHAGSPFNLITVNLVWECPVCGGPRGKIGEGFSYDGSRRLAVSIWHNPCNHVDYYKDVRQEAKNNGLN